MVPSHFFNLSLLLIIPTLLIKQIICISLSLLFVSSFFYGFFGTYSHTRALFLFLLPLFLLIGAGYELVSLQIKGIYTKRVLSIFLVLYIVFIFNEFSTTYAQDISPLQPEAFEWLNDNLDLTNTLLVSDYGTTFASMFHINTLNSQYFQNHPVAELSSADASLASYFEGNTSKPKIIHDIFSEPLFTANSFSFLNNMITEFGADDILLIISPRTRQAIWMFDESDKKTLYQVRSAQRGSNFSFTGEFKFLTNPLFELVYGNDETQIYRYNPFLGLYETSP